MECIADEPMEVIDVEDEENYDIPMESREVKVDDSAAAGGSIKAKFREKLKDKDIIVFRNRIYYLEDYNYGTWKLYDYFDRYNAGDKDTSKGIVAYIRLDKEEFDTLKWHDKLIGISLDIFVSEARIITVEELPAEVTRCMVNILKLKVVKHVPLEVIKQHEDYHCENLQKKINEFIDKFIDLTLSSLEKHKTIVNYMHFTFSVCESDLCGGFSNSKKKIFYKYPGTDGVLRKTYKEYLNYIFQKLYPLESHLSASAEADSIETKIASDNWICVKMHQLLCERYPYLCLKLQMDGYITLALPTTTLFC